LIALSRIQPIALFIDDVQWADAATLGLLGYLVRVTAASANPMVFVAASRPVEPRTASALLIQTLTREGRVLRLVLDRLSSTDTIALAQISPAFAYPLAGWLMQQSEGNPYILSELISHARLSGILQPDGTVNLMALSSSPVVPPSIYSLIRPLARLSDPARRILDAAVAMGRVFEPAKSPPARLLSQTMPRSTRWMNCVPRADRTPGIGRIEPFFDHSLTMGSGLS
jgi:predicted ATPase